MRLFHAPAACSPIAEAVYATCRSTSSRSSSSRWRATSAPTPSAAVCWWALHALPSLSSSRSCSSSRHRPCTARQPRHGQHSAMVAFAHRSVWCAGLGYILAYFTGPLVWLTLRGNREPDEEEEREREEIRSRISGEDVVGFDLAELQATADERDMEVEQDTNRWMAPEIADILTGSRDRRRTSANVSVRARTASSGRAGRRSPSGQIRGHRCGRVEQSFVRVLADGREAVGSSGAR